ncbi:uncharacterized protein [Drosophila takahashii]|uniref:uncharacterized protein n=1 Tax=Drosophila takahashii TaxID=29030 RepID=UPI0038992BB8
MYGPSCKVETFALIDEGSACTLIETHVAEKLGIDGPSDELCLRWTGEITQMEAESMRVNLTISPSYDAVRKFTLREDSELIAAKSRLGWSVYGRKGDTGKPASSRVMHVCECNNDQQLDVLIKESFSLDAVGVSISNNTLRSKEDERANRILNESTTYNRELKRWQTGLLWRYDNVKLPSSREMAMRRLQCLETRMAKDKELREFVNQQIRRYEQLGYIRKLGTDEMIDEQRTWYLPIFVVKNPSKGKSRLVWDAAAKVEGIALNTMLLKGPDQLPSLVGVILRFRQKAVGICGDVKEMFHQIMVRKEDQGAQQFLWRYGDNSREPDRYVMRVMTFGASCSPAAANYVRDRNAKQFLDEHPKAARAILRNTFVDDWLQSCESEEEMVRLAQEMQVSMLSPRWPTYGSKNETVSDARLRLATFLEQELSIGVKRRVFWTDSKNVLYWIRSDARKYHQFVVLRIGEILENSETAEWKWVPSALNVADDGTKWTKESSFQADSRWFTGPSFLLESEEHWPVTDLSPHILERINVHELKETSLSMLASIVPEINRFSKWEKLRGALKCVMHFLSKICKKELASEEAKIATRIRNLDDVNNVIYRIVQEEAYAEAIILLRRGTVLGRKSPIYKLTPYLDEAGVLRIRGRINRMSGVDMNVKRPVILPKEHKVTNLLVDYFHRKFHHQLTEIVVNEMRQLYHIPGLRAKVRSLANACQRCRNKKAAPEPPEMGDIPPERLAINELPFTNTGIDYFGPFEVNVGRRREKRWGVLFTCLTVRAVHIELASSLSTDTFMLILEMFVARRGVPKRIMSDNGTNFRGASRLLQEEIERISSKELENKYPEIEWSFIPPGAPHMGGAWERMIRSVKSILFEILEEKHVQEPVLRAALARIENTLNSRPLTYVPLETPEADALTPNHFLRGASSAMVVKDGNTNGILLGKSFRIAGQIADSFKKRWLREYLPCLTQRAKWHGPPNNPICIGDVVIIFDESNPKVQWKKGIIMDLRVAKDGIARSAVIRTATGLLTRPIVKLAKLDVNKPATAGEDGGHDVDGILSRLPPARYITGLDMKHAFWQIPLEEKSRQCTAFTIPNRPLYQYKNLTPDRSFTRRNAIGVFIPSLPAIGWYARTRGASFRPTLYAGSKTVKGSQFGGGFKKPGRQLAGEFIVTNQEGTFATVDGGVPSACGSPAVRHFQAAAEALRFHVAYRQRSFPSVPFNVTL